MRSVLGVKSGLPPLVVLTSDAAYHHEPMTLSTLQYWHWTLDGLFLLFAKSSFFSEAQGSLFRISCDLLAELLFLKRAQSSSRNVYFPILSAIEVVFSFFSTVADITDLIDGSCAMLSFGIASKQKTHPLNVN